MKLEVPGVRWHWDDKSAFPLMAIDMHPSGRLATAGQDGIIRIWHVRPNSNGASSIDFISEFRGHDTTINALSFSPNGMFLASAGDDKLIYIWRYDGPKNAQANPDPVFGDDELGLYNVENWRVETVLTGHSTEIVDLAWHQSSLMLTTAAMSGYVITWTVTKPTNTLSFAQQPLIPVTTPVSRDFSGMGTARAQWLSNVPHAAAHLYAADYLRYAATVGVPVADASGKVWAGAVGDVIIPGETSQMGASTFKLNTQKLISGEITGKVFTGNEDSGFSVSSSAPNDNGDPVPLPMALPLVGSSDLIQSLKPALTLCDHKLHVQGVAWDPLGRYVATLGADRALRVYSALEGLQGAASAGGDSGALNVAKKMLLKPFVEVMRKRAESGDEEGEMCDVAGTGTNAAPATPSSSNSAATGKSESSLYFAKEQTATYYRRLHWSPDGTMLACPAGILDTESSGKQENSGNPTSSGIDSSFSSIPGKDGREPPSLLGSSGGDIVDITGDMHDRESAKTTTFSSSASSSTPYCTHIFLRSCLHTPAISLPFDEPTIAVRFSPTPLTDKPLPVLNIPATVASDVGSVDMSTGVVAGETGMGTREEQKTEADSESSSTHTFPMHPSLTGTRYYYLLAVASTRSITVYRTDSMLPVAMCRNVHHAPLTDMAWSADGTQLCVSSQDGFLSLLKLQDNELGVPLTGLYRQAYDAYIADMQWRGSSCPLLHNRGMGAFGLASATALPEDLSLLTPASESLAAQAHAASGKTARASVATTTTTTSTVTAPDSASTFTSIAAPAPATGTATGTGAAAATAGATAEEDADMADIVNTMTTWSFREALYSFATLPSQVKRQLICDVFGTCQMRDDEEEKDTKRSKSTKGDMKSKTASSAVNSSVTLPGTSPIPLAPTPVDVAQLVNAISASTSTSVHSMLLNSDATSVGSYVAPLAAPLPVAFGDIKTIKKSYSDDDVKQFIRSYYSAHGKFPTKKILCETMHMGYARCLSLWEAMHKELGVPLAERTPRKTANDTGANALVAPSPTMDIESQSYSINRDVREEESQVAHDDVLSPHKKQRLE